MSEELEKLKKVLELEKRGGYQDVVVIGGLEGFVKNIVPKAFDLVQGYSTMPLSKRRWVIEELEDVIRSLEVELEVAPSSEEKLQIPIRRAKGVGVGREKLLKRLGIETLEDLLTYLPRRIEDRSAVKKIASLQHGEKATVKGRVRALNVIKPKEGMEILKVAVQDNSGVIYAVWFNRPWLKSQFIKGEKISLYGEANRSFGQVQMENPVWEPADQNFNTARLVPIYPLTEGLPQPILRRIIYENLSRVTIEDTIPPKIRERNDLLSKAEATWKIHFPKTLEEFEKARETLAFEELFLFQLGVAREREQLIERTGRSLRISDDLLEEFIGSLPFKLTAAQTRVIEEIRRDMAAPWPMNRLLQGDVGSGKTVVAMVTCLITFASGYQAAFMAPTEILAQQHYENIKGSLEPFGLKIYLLIGSLPEKEKAAIREKVAAGEADLLLGTHALIQDEVKFKKLGLAVIDEQHRFGVIQRAELERKGENINILVMSATPIPRTITLTLYGQFDISIIDELPHKKDVHTYWVSEDKRFEIYKIVAEKVKGGNQAYVVYPLIEESEELDLKAAARMKEELERTFFKDFKVGLLHGRMSDGEKREVMRQLKDKEIDVLISTTIIEVGIDVPDASVMIIEHAERFGLSQLHQLRGRIGRAGQKAICFAIATPKTEEARRRLSVFQKENDGFKIAEEDLKIRGPGELLGVAQHGVDFTFKAANLIRDLKIMQKARKEAFQLIKENPKHLLSEFERRFGKDFELARV